MFLSMKERFEAVMDLVDDILAADPDPDREPEPAPPHPHAPDAPHPHAHDAPHPHAPHPYAPDAPHPHDRTVVLRIERRGGSVGPREMHCLCPVRPAPERSRRAQVSN
jgi:hypothetical protein